MGLEVLAGLSLGATALGTGISAMGAGMTANANSQAAAYRAQVARNNAIIAENNAQQALLTAQGNTQRIGFRGAEQIGQIRAVQGASGIDVNSGSFQAVQDSAAIINRLDQLQEIWKGQARATDYRNQAAGFMATAGLSDAEAANAKTAGNLSVASSLISGAGQFGSKWAGFQLNGVL